MPAVRVLQQRDQLPGRGAAQVGRLRLPESVRDDAIDAAAVVAAVEVQMLLDGLGQRPGMLDDFAIHVGDVKRTVRRVGKLHRAKPVVATGQELHLLFVVRPPGDQGGAIRMEFLSMHEIAPAVGDEGVLAIVLRESVAAIDGCAGRAGEVTGGAPAALDRAGNQAGDTPARAEHAPRFVGTDAKDLRCRPVRGYARARRRHGEERISVSVTVFVHDELDVVAVAANEFPTPAVETHPVLGPAALGAKIERAWIKRKILAAQIHPVRIADCGLGILAGPLHPGSSEGAVHTANLSAAHAGRAVDAVIETPIERIEQGLHIQPVRLVRRKVAGKSGKNRFADVRHAVAVGVLAEDNIGCRPDEHTATVTENRRRPRQAVQINRALVEAAVAVGVLKSADAPESFRASLGVVAHLDHVHPTILIKGHRNGIDYQRFRRGQLEMKPLFDLKGGQGNVRLGRRQAGKVFFRDVGFRRQRVTRPEKHNRDHLFAARWHRPTMK